MAYSTGTGTGQAAILSALSTFLQANGWTLFDTVASDDLVFSSPGSNSKFKMFFRFTLNTSANNPWKYKGSPQQAVPMIICRGYQLWNNSTHVGTKEYGIAGPSLLATQTNRTGAAAYTEYRNWRIDSSAGAAFQSGDTDYQWPTFQGLTSGSSPQPVLSRLNGCRYSVGVDIANNSKLRIVDLITGDSKLSAANTGAYNLTVNGQPEIVYDSATDKWFVYILSNANAVVADSLWKYDMEADSWARATSAPVSVNQTTGGGWVLWDGGNLLYTCFGSSSTAFYTYNVSTTVWSSALAVFPSTPSNGFTANNSGAAATNAVYVPTSVTSFSSDVIYTLVLNSGTTIRSYNVTTNTWNDSGHSTPDLTAPATIVSSTWLTWDHQKYMYFGCKNSQTNFWRSDLTAAPGTFTAGALNDSTSTNMCGVQILNEPCGRVRVNAAQTSTYFFNGTQDGVVVVVRMTPSTPGNTNRYYWMYFGRMTTRRKSAIMTLQSGVSAGTNVSMQVDSSLLYAVGDFINLFDPSNAVQENARINAIADSTHITATIVNNYTTNTLIADDPYQTCITGDSGLVGVPIDPSGFKADFESCIYLLQPTGYMVPNYPTAGTQIANVALFNSINSDGKGRMQPVEGLASFWATVAVPSTFPLTRIGLAGTIPGIYFSPVGTYPKAQAEDIVPVNGHNYLFFPQQENNIMPFWNYGIVMGPTN